MFRVLVFVMMFSSVAMAKSGVFVEYGEQGLPQKSIEFSIDDKEKVFSFDNFSTMCKIENKDDSIITFCDHRENGSGSISKCDGESLTLVFQNKKKNKRFVAKIKCIQEKI